MVKKIFIVLIGILIVSVFASPTKATACTDIHKLNYTKHCPGLFTTDFNSYINLSTFTYQNQDYPDHIYHFTDSTVTVNSTTVTGDNTGVIFIDGSLNIIGDISHPNPNGGIVFIVKGDVNIDQAVTRIDAVIIANGIICTAYNTTATPPNCPQDNVTTIRNTSNPIQQLVINGSLISIDQKDECSGFDNPNGKCPILFKRSLGGSDANTPAEKIIYQPKYLVLLRNMLSDTVQKWSEIQ